MKKEPTQKQKKNITRLCVKLIRLTSVYKSIASEKKSIGKAIFEAKTQAQKMYLQKWNASFYTRYRYVNTEVKHCSNALQKHADKFFYETDKEYKTIMKCIYNAVKA